MAQVFKAKKTIFVPATGGHPENTEYRVAWGQEQWSNPTDVTKVQMVYKGAVAGMLSPSFPDGTLDLKAVRVALEWLDEVDEDTYYVCLLKEITNVDSNLIEALEDEVDNWVVNVFESKRKPQMILTDVSLEKEREVENGLVAFLFKVKIFSSK
ncbi:hypothetical protein [Ureibacillus chungkukjangi]|uniref:Uncharacterized protein n=1 Tax=Ureibacillus chungkukjangi TaxID=1202712 RepID=A0A318T9E8_9BACL|nr:hypothetical protein [Ureibacillus chungkukjangi]PYF01762.1 hypothetical protein BJ095_1594 [Ureibacillus chungkukjangi]